MLLIAVPDTDVIDGGPYPPLPYATAEALAIKQVLSAEELGIRLKSLVGDDAKYETVVEEIETNTYHIIHFCGHAYFNSKDSRNSSLVLKDHTLSTTWIADNLSAIRPILCFINACDSAKIVNMPEEKEGKKRFNLHGLGRVFLETGGYLLGNRWQVNDAVARTFATEFYRRTFGNGEPLGEAVRAAREASRLAVEEDYGWTSYIFYGDPRVRFRREFT